MFCSKMFMIMFSSPKFVLITIYALKNEVKMYMKLNQIMNTFKFQDGSMNVTLRRLKQNRVLSYQLTVSAVVMTFSSIVIC